MRLPLHGSPERSLRKLCAPTYHSTFVSLVDMEILLTVRITTRYHTRHLHIWTGL